MRGIILAMVAMGVLASPLRADGTKDKKDGKKVIAWEKTWDDAMKKAQADKKAVLLFISSDYMLPSKTFQSKWLGDAKVIEAAQRVVCVKVDTGGKDKDHLAKWGTKKGPEVRFFDYKENQLGEPTTEVKKVEDLVELIDKAAKYCEDMANTIEWIQDWDTALKKAKELKKPVFVDYGTEW